MSINNAVFRTVLCSVVGAFIASSAYAAQFQPPQTAREKLNFDLDWKYRRGDQRGAEAPDYNDDSWESVNLPHSLQILSVDGDEVDRGMGWYRRRFTLDSRYGDKVLTLYFEGAMSVSTVWTNGTELPTNYGGFHPFCFDITRYCKTDGSENVIALRLNNASNELVPPEDPVTGTDYELFGGLNKDVYLIATEKLYVPEAIHSWNSGWGEHGGHYITYSNIRSNSATIKVETWVKNVTGSSVSGKLVTSVVDPVSGQLLQSDETTLTAGNNEVAHITQSINVSGIRLWAPWSPNVYQVYTVVYNGDTPVDYYTTRIGIREITWNKNSGASINGTPFKIIGLNRTNQWVFLGHACPNNQQKRDAAVLREWGCNFARCAHYPMDDAFYDGCDSVGLLLWVEVPSWHCCDTKPTTNATWVDRMKNELRFMVRNGRNRASIAIWGVGTNEGAKSQAFDGPMNELSLSEDPTRPTSAARQAGTESSNNIFTFYGQNEFIPGDLPNANPDPNCVGFMNTEHTGHMFHDHSIRATSSEQELLDHATMMACMTSDGRDRPWCSGSLGWCAFDYYTHWNTSVHWRAVHGVFDVMHIPKFAAYFYKSQSGGDNYDGSIHPMVKIANFYQQNSPVDRRVYSNCDQVRLYRGSTLIGTQRPDTRPYYVTSVGSPNQNLNLAHPPFTFRNVEFQANTMLIAEGLINNAVVARDTVYAPQNATTIRLIADPPVLEANGQDISRIEAYIIDNNGAWLHAATHSVRWSLSGSAAELVGDNPIRAQAGACITLAKATVTPGTITVEASSNGLASQTVTIDVHAPDTLSTALAVSAPGRNVSRCERQWRALPVNNRLILPAGISLPATIGVYTVSGELVYKGEVDNRTVRMDGKRSLSFRIYVVNVVGKSDLPDWRIQ